MSPFTIYKQKQKEKEKRKLYYIYTCTDMGAELYMPAIKHFVKCLSILSG